MYLRPLKNNATFVVYCWLNWVMRKVVFYIWAVFLLIMAYCWTVVIFPFFLLVFFIIRLIDFGEFIRTGLYQPTSFWSESEIFMVKSAWSYLNSFIDIKNKA